MNRQTWLALPILNNEVLILSECASKSIKILDYTVLRLKPRCQYGLSALLESRQHAKCFILHIPRARPCLNCFKDLTKECLVKAYPFESITWPISSSNYKVR